MKIAGLEINLHPRRLMGPASFWLEAIHGDHRVDVYFEPVNGWRHHTFRRGTIWIGPLLVIGQNWRRKKALREVEESALKGETERLRRTADTFPPEVDRLLAAAKVRDAIVAEVRTGEGDPFELAERLSEAERELDAATLAYEDLLPSPPGDAR